MANLPIITQKLYTHKLTGLGKEIQYRAFTNKEQKILLLAAEEESQKEKYLAVQQLINNCTLGKLDILNLPIFDILDLFTRIREISVGNQTSLRFNVDDPETGRTKFYDVNINLNDVKVVVPEGHTTEFMLDDTYGIKMKYPTLAMVDLEKPAESYTERDVVLKCIDYVYDKDTIYDTFSSEELEAFYDSLDFRMNAAIERFFETLPDIQIEVKFKLDDGEEVTKIVKGIDGFFPS